MSVRVLALESGVTSLEDHRLGLTVFQYPVGALTATSGIRPGGATLTNPAAMVARISPFTAWIHAQGTQGGYSFVSDDDEDITFDAGEAGVTRTDRIIARIYDDTYDASGFTQGTVEYLKGQPSGSATALPVSSILLYEVPVLAGASAGGTPINFSNAVDSRSFTATNGAILPVASATIRDSMSGHDGKAIYRQDRDWLEFHDGIAWKVNNIPKVSSVANLSLITSPSTGDLAVTTDTGNVYVRFNSAWNLITQGPGAPRVGQCVLRIRSTSGLTFTAGVPTDITWGIEDWDTFSFHSTSVNTARVTPTVAGLYTFNGAVAFDANASGNRTLWWAKNGGVDLGSQTLFPPASGSATVIPARSTTYQMNGTTDYVVLRAQSSVTVNHVTSSNQVQTSMEVHYVGPLP